MLCGHDNEEILPRRVSRGHCASKQTLRPRDLFEVMLTWCECGNEIQPARTNPAQTKAQNVLLNRCCEDLHDSDAQLIMHLHSQISANRHKMYKK